MIHRWSLGLSGIRLTGFCGNSVRYKTTQSQPVGPDHNLRISNASAPFSKAPQSKLEAREMDHAHESLVDLSRRKDAKSLRDLLRSARNYLKDRTRRLFVNHIKRSNSARLYLFGILREVLGSNLIALDYEVKTRPRYTPGFPPSLV
jgi:hypothetical protein